MENILDIVYNYSRQNKLLDKFAIRYILLELLDEEKLDYITIEIDDKDKILYLNNKLATFKSNTIKVFLSRINEYIASDNYKTNYKNEYILNRFQKCLRKNLIILQTLMHENEHVLQFHKEKENTIEDNLTNLELEFIDETENIMENKNIGLFKRLNEFKKNKNLYNNNYQISFLERMADINSYQNVLSLIEPIKNEAREVYDLENDLLLESIMKNYKNIMDAPSIRFFINIGKLDELNKLDLVNLSEEERLRLGLKIDGKDYISNNAYLLSKKKRF